MCVAWLPCCCIPLQDLFDVIGLREYADIGGVRVLADILQVSRQHGCLNTVLWPVLTAFTGSGSGRLWAPCRYDQYASLCARAGSVAVLRMSRPTALLCIAPFCMRTTPSPAMQYVARPAMRCVNLISSLCCGRVIGPLVQPLTIQNAPQVRTRQAGSTRSTGSNSC